MCKVTDKLKEELGEAIFNDVIDIIEEKVNEFSNHEIVESISEQYDLEYDTANLCVLSYQMGG